MTTFTRALVALLLVAASVVLVGLGSAPASAAIGNPPVHQEQVNGDFEVVGNTVLDCPSGATRAACLTASQRGGNPAASNNNSYAMTYADVDGDDETIDSSSARVTIPAGSRVTYARLDWGGNSSGLCVPGQSPAPTYPSGAGPQTRPVQLSVDGGTPRPHVSASDAFHRDTTGSVRYYVAGAVVTSAFADAPTGQPITVTVGDVYAPQGRGCHGGWSLTLIHTNDAAPCGSDRREVVVYDGYVRQGSGDPATTVDVSGFRVSGGPARVGVTAYEGDNGTDGDALTLNGTALADPATGSTTNFFASTAQGASAPAYANSFSIDAKSLDVPAGVVPVGSTSATLATSTSGDAFALQQLVLSVPVPSLCLTKTVDHPVARAGDPLVWTITVTNPTTTDALGVTVADPEVADCDGHDLGTVPAGGSASYTCTSTAPADDLTNVATATGTAAGGNELSATAAASVDVVHPAIAVTKRADPAVVVGTGSATWTLTVENTGDTDLTGVTADDDTLDACDRSLGTLTAGSAAVTWTCTGPVTADRTNTVVATGTPPVGPAVTDSATARVDVVTPAIGVTVTVDDDSPTEGDEVTFTVVVDNTGDTPLENVTVVDPKVPDCEVDGLTVAAGASRTLTCVSHPVDTFTNELTVTGEVIDRGRVVDRVEATDTTLVTVSPASTSSGGGSAAGGAGFTGSLPDAGAPRGAQGMLASGSLLLVAGLVLVVACRPRRLRPA